MLAALCTLAALFAVTTAATAACTDNLGCQLNGECVAGACRCDQGWQGTDCGRLHLRTDANVAYGYTNTSQISCWGGGPPVYDPVTSKYQLLVSQIAGHCGMSTWSRLSTSVRATALQPEGPYKFAEMIVGSESHNTIYAYSPTDQVHLMYSIFEGTWPQSCNPTPACTDGTTPGGKGLHPPALPNNTCGGSPGGRSVVHWAKSFAGPWSSVGPVTVDWGAGGQPPNGGLSNPAPYIFPNGSVLLLGRGKDTRLLENGTRVIGHNIWLFRVESWNSTYHWVPSNGAFGSLNVGDPNGRQGPSTEDPVLYHGRRGFHIIFHSHPDLTHAWSADGLIWHWSPQVSGPPNHMAQGGGDNERPRVLLTADGDLDWLFVGQLLAVTGAGGGQDAARLAAFKAI
eukprot:COSAG05_NODE_4677_length_1414_cov_1.565779_1_plen_398_part_00